MAVSNCNAHFISLLYLCLKTTENHKAIVVVIMKLKNWRQTKQTGVKIQPNAPICMQDEIIMKQDTTALCNGVWQCSTYDLTHNVGVTVCNLLPTNDRKYTYKF